MTTTTTSDPYPQVPSPAGSRWVVDRREDLPSSQDIEVYIRGTQDPDGTVEREIVVNQLHAEDPITPQQARQLAGALTARLLTRSTR